LFFNSSVDTVLTVLENVELLLALTEPRGERMWGHLELLRHFGFTTLASFRKSRNFKQRRARGDNKGTHQQPEDNLSRRPPSSTDENSELVMDLFVNINARRRLR